MPAGETVMETWKRVVIFVMVMAVLVAVVSSFWAYASYANHALQLRDTRVQTQEVLAAWSGTGNMSGVVRLSEVNESDLDPGTTVRIYYANGTLAREVSLPE